VKNLLPPNPLICLITDGTLTAENFREKSSATLRTIENAVQSNVSLIQIREKNLPAKFVFELTEKASQIARDSKKKLLVNDRADIAFLAGADGVHLTANSMPTEIVRQSFPDDFIIGVSCHTPEECARAKAAGANFVALAPIFSTPHKGAPKGLKVLRAVCENLAPFPVVALGGVDETNCESVLQIAAGYAAIRFLNERFSARRRRDAEKNK
jgi:thiamine-phosphate pyrophosphorylase